MKTKSLNKSILFLILILFGFGKSSIKPTKHYLIHHSDVPLEVVKLTVVSPTQVKTDKRYGKNRFIFKRKFKKFTSKVHAEIDHNKNVWVINAFMSERK